MNRQTSIYLDGVRFAAALTVFVSHISSRDITGSFLWQASNLGVPAVAVFFALSGYVIAYVTDRREDTLGAYAVSSAARIYSVALPALLLTFALDGLGRNINPDWYAHVSWLSSDLRDVAVQAFAGMTFTNEVWGWHLFIGTDGPYWSLGFEVWYYVVFAAWIFTPMRWRMVAVVVCLLIAGPKVAIMFPLWLIGVGAYRLACSGRVGSASGTLLFAAGACILLGGAIWLALLGGHGINMAAQRPLTDWRGLRIDYAIGLAFAATVLGVHACKWLATPLLMAERPIRWAAGATFTLYLTHMPIFIFLRALSPWDVSSWQNRVLVVLGTLAAVLLFAQVTERRKEAWRRAILRLGGIVRPARS